MKGVAPSLRAVVHIKPHRRAPLALFRQATAYKRKAGGITADEAPFATSPSYRAQRRSGYPGDAWYRGGEGAEFIYQSRRSSPGDQQTVQRYQTQHKGKFSTVNAGHRWTVGIQTAKQPKIP